MIHLRKDFIPSLCVFTCANQCFRTEKNGGSPNNVPSEMTALITCRQI